MDILAIDIGTVSIKYLRWRGKKGKGIVVSTRDYPYKGGWEDLQKILSEIRSMEAGDVRVALAVTSQEILKKTFTIPELLKDELKEALVWSASKVVSTPLEEMAYENVMLGAVDERGIRKDEVLFIGATKGFVNRLLAVCEDAGFRKVTLITDTAVLYPTLVSEAVDGSTAVIDVGGKLTGIYIIDAKKLRFVREIMTASESFSDALITGFGVSFQEAERYKRGKGFNPESEYILSLPFERLGAEIQRTFNVYGQRYPDKPITRVYIAGRGSRMPNLVERLKYYIGEEIDRFPTPIPVDDQFLLCYCICTVGESVVNLLSKEVQQKEKEERYKRWVGIGSLALVAVFVVLSLDMWGDLTKTKLAVQAEKAALSQKEQSLEGAQSQSSLGRYTELLPGLNDLQKSNEIFLTLMKFLSSRLPKDVYLKEVEFYKYKGLKIASQEAQGTAPKEEAPPKDAIKNAIKDAIKDSIKDTIKYIVQGDQSKEGAEKKQDTEKKPGVKDGGQLAKEPRLGLVALSGYIVGDVEVQGVVLLDLVVKLQKSGLLQDVDVVSKQAREMKGQKVMEFRIEAGCTPYEV